MNFRKLVVLTLVGLWLSACGAGFGLGFGLPLLVLPFLTEATRKFVLQKMMVHHHLLARVAGILLIGIGTIGFVKDLPMIRSYWGF